MPRAVTHVIPPAPIPAHPDEDPQRPAATWHALAYLIGLRFYSDSRRKQRLQVVGVWSGSEVLLKDVSNNFCRVATAAWTQSMVDQFGLDENDEPLAEPVDWERLMRAQSPTVARPVAEALIEEAEQAEAARLELVALMQGRPEDLSSVQAKGDEDPWLPGFEDF